MQYCYCTCRHNYQYFLDQYCRVMFCDRLWQSCEWSFLGFQLQESEDQFVQAERRINSLKSSLDEKEREVIASSQKLQEVLSVSAASEKTVKQLEEAIQR